MAEDELLLGVLSTGDNQEALTTEDYARLAQVNPDFLDRMSEGLMELDADQACALFDLARKGMEADKAFAAGREAERRDVVRECNRVARLSEMVIDLAVTALRVTFERGEHVTAAWKERGDG